MSQTPPRPRSVVGQVERLLDQRRYEEAVELSRYHLRQEPTDIALRLLLGRAFMLLHQDDEARTEMVACLRVDPRCAAAYRLLGELSLRSDDYRRAEEYLRHAAALDPSDPGTDVLLSLVHSMAGGGAAQAGDTDRSLSAIRQRSNERLSPYPVAAERPQGHQQARHEGHQEAHPHGRSIPTRQLRPTLDPNASRVRTPQSLRIENASRPGRVTMAPGASMTRAGAMAPRSPAHSPSMVAKRPGTLHRREPEPPIFAPSQSSFTRLAKLVETLAKERPIHDSFSLRIVGSWSALAVVCVMLAWGALTAVRSGKPATFLDGAKAGIASFVQGGPSLPPPVPAEATASPGAGNQKSQFGSTPAQAAAGTESGAIFMGENMLLDTWMHPLGGPVRRMPIREARAFGAERPGDRPFECQSGHCGVDIGERWGEPVFAVHDGVVERIQRGPNPDHGGKYVRLSHRNGTIFTQYFHLASIPTTLAVGMRVKAGQVIGLVGDTGVKHSSAHLHFAISVRPTPTSPEKYFDPEPLLALWPLRMSSGEGPGGVLDHNARPGVPLGAAWSTRTPRRKKKSVAQATTRPRKRPALVPVSDTIHVN